MLLALARSHRHDWAMSVVNYKIGDAPLDRSSYASMAPSTHDDEIRFQVLGQSHNLLSYTPKPEMGSVHSPPADLHPPGQFPEYLLGLLFDLIVVLAIQTQDVGIFPHKVGKLSDIYHVQLGVGP